MEPAEPYRLYESQQPVIIAMWHGQHFLLPFLRRQYRFKVLISRHSDGEINAIAAERLGIGTVRGSGDHGTAFPHQGRRRRIQGHAGFARGRLEHGADRRRAEGLACRRPRHHQTCAESGRPIFPVSLATSRRIVLDNWDRSEINLPFSRGGIVVGEPIRVPKDADTTHAARGRGRRLKKRSMPQPNALMPLPIGGLERMRSCWHRSGLRLSAGYE